MTSKLIDKLTKFCFHSASPTTPASHTHNPSKPNPQPLLASPPTPLRMERGMITEINLLLGITKPNSIGFTAKFCLYFTPSLYLSLCHSVSKKTLCLSMSLCHFVSKKNSVIICLYVILSLKNTLSLLVPMLFCLQNILCHYMSLCHFVSKKKLCHYSSLCYSVSKKICLYSSLCYSVSKKTLCHYMSVCHSVSKKTLCLYSSLCYSVSKKNLSLLVPMLFCL